MAEEQKQGDQPKPNQYYLVVLDEDIDGGPQCIACEDEDALTEAVEQHVLSAKHEIYAFLFRGERIPIGSPRPVCTLDIGGTSRQIGKASAQYDETGRIVPLIAPGRAVPSDA